MLFNNEKFVIKFVKIKQLSVKKKTAGLRCGNFSDLNSACLKVLVPIKIFQFPDMRNEIERYRDATNGLYQITGLQH